MEGELEGKGRQTINRVVYYKLLFDISVSLTHLRMLNTCVAYLRSVERSSTSDLLILFLLETHVCT